MVIRLINKYNDNRHVMIPTYEKVKMCSGIKISKMKDKAVKAFKKVKKGVNKYGPKLAKASYKLKRKALDLLTNDAVQDVVSKVPYVGDTINTITKVTKKVVDKAEDYMKDKSKLSPETLINDVKEVKNDLMKDKQINDAIQQMKEKIMKSNLKEQEKQELLENEKDLNTDDKTIEGGRLALGMLIKRNDRHKDVVTIPARLRRELNIKQKTLSNKGGKLFKSKGCSAPAKKTIKSGQIKGSKEELLKYLTTK